MRAGTERMDQTPRTLPRFSATFDPGTLSEIRRAAATGIYDVRGGGAKGGGGVTASPSPSSFARNSSEPRNSRRSVARSGVIAARDGIAAEASENVETLTIADVNLADLSWARAEGTVRNLRDRRFDLYKTVWTDGG